MLSATCERAIEDALRFKCAILKFISANDVDLTGAHQAGFYLPKAVWSMFSPNPPVQGIVAEHHVRVIWQNGQDTDSMVKWYGQGTRSEYRLTRFGRDFPFRTFDNLGDLLVLIPKSLNEFLAFVLDTEDDIEGIQSALGVDIIDRWACYGRFVETEIDPNSCIDRNFRAFAERVDTLPEGEVFSSITRDALQSCVQGFNTLIPDDQLLRLLNEEYNLYRMVERKVFQPEVSRLFQSIDDFLQTAQSILQSRKARAGRSLENHIEYLLSQANIPFEMRPSLDQTRPDIIIPSKEAYDDPSFPENKIFVVGVKRTCKDRWRQVTREAPRVHRKHILTIQRGISAPQLCEMQRENIQLVVPQPIHIEYPREFQGSLLSVDSFLRMLQSEFLHG